MTAAPQGLGPIVTTATPMVSMSKDSKAIFMGTGFHPDQEVVLLLNTPDGVVSDIGYALEPPPKADTSGTWATTWNAGRYVSRKLVNAGVHTITAADTDYNEIGQVPRKFLYDEKVERFPARERGAS